MNWARRLILFGLGILLILDSLVNEFKAFEFILGTIMVGLFPIDYIIDAWAGPTAPNDEETIRRLEEVMKKHEDEDGTGS